MMISFTRRCRFQLGSESGSDNRKSRSDSEKRKRRKITDEEIAEYLAKKAMKVANKLKSSQTLVSGYSINDSSNLNNETTFVWRKKIEQDISQGVVPIDEIVSIKAEKKRQRERMAEIENLKKRRGEKAIEKAQRGEEMARLAKERINRAAIQDWEKKEEEFDFVQSKIRSEIRLLREVKPINVMDDDAAEAEVVVCSRKPKYELKEYTGHEWNKYNQTHYDCDNPPPKIVKGYKFDIFYPDLIDKSKVPTYTIVKHSSDETNCIIRFHAGPPYEDIEFPIVDKEWEKSSKNGFKCTFEGGTLHLYFNFKRYRYRR